jgi:hypothetical protein
VAAGRRSVDMALFVRRFHFAGLVRSHEATESSDVCRQTAAGRRSTRSPVAKWLRADDNKRDYQSIGWNALAWLRAYAFA